MRTNFQNAVDHLAEGDSALGVSLRPALSSVTPHIRAGDLFIATWPFRLVTWYEVLEAPQGGAVFVRVYSWLLKRGEYDRVPLDRLDARVTPELFARARVQGFRTVRPLN